MKSTDMTIAEARRALANREITSEQLVKDHLAGIAQLNPVLGTHITMPNQTDPDHTSSLSTTVVSTKV